MTQTKTKHTPAPWKYEAETKTIRSVPANYWLATMDSFDGAVNHEANASLIAIAPELFEIVQGMADCFAKGISCNFQPGCAMDIKMRSVLAKASAA